MTTKVLCVDDDVNLLAAIQRGLRQPITIDTAAGGEQALAMLDRDGPYAVIVADMQMLGLDGVQFLNLARQKSPDTVQFMLTGNPDLCPAIDARNQGQIFQYLSKPCSPDTLALAVENGIKRYRLVRTERQLLERTLNGSIKVLTEVLSLMEPCSLDRRGPDALEASVRKVGMDAATRDPLRLGDARAQTQLEAQWRQAQKMETVGQLVIGVAHDFSNMLTGIRCQAETVLAYEPISPSAREALQLVVTATEHSANLTRQLLAFSRQQPMQPAAVDLNALVVNHAKMLQRLISEDIRLRLNFEPELPPIHADQSMVEQVLLNFAVNAKDAMPHGGELTIATGLFRVDADYLRHHPKTCPARYPSADGAASFTVLSHGASIGEFIMLKVSDNGCGIAPEVLPRIFEPFFTTKELGKGTGIGLATVFGIVQQHQGWIEVESHVGRGTSFRVCFPARRDLVAEAGALPDQPCIASGDETVLVVEDEPVLRDAICRILELLGYHVLDASSGVEALKLWQDHADTIRLVLTDIVMPDGVGGCELVGRLRAEKPELKTIVMSGYRNKMPAAELEFKPAFEFLAKPFDMNTLAALVRNCLDEGRN